LAASHYHEQINKRTKIDQRTLFVCCLFVVCLLAFAQPLHFLSLLDESGVGGQNLASLARGWCSPRKCEFLAIKTLAQANKVLA
jgi:hypothetical protein